MLLLDVKEWFDIADDDLRSAIFLTNAHPKPMEIICYHCAQATEKYLKGFLEYNDIIPEKKHNLLALLNRCISADITFHSILYGCKFLNQYNNQIRYPKAIEVCESDMNRCIQYTEKIKNLNIITKKLKKRLRKSLYDDDL